MIRTLLIAASGAAILFGGLVGCSDDKSVSEQVADATDTAKEAVTSATDAAKDAIDGNSVTVDGESQEINGSVVCATMGDTVAITIGDAAGGLAATVSTGDDPVVRNVALGNVGGVTLGYTEGTPSGEATATKDGDRYTITGTATGVDMANPTQPATKPFEIKVSCS